MQYCNRHLKGVVSPIVAATLVLLVLAINLLAACPSLHEKLHHDAHEHDHQCAITLFAHGQVDQSSVVIDPPVAALGLEIFLLVSVFSFVSTRVILPSDRGPPLAATVS